MKDTIKSNWRILIAALAMIVGTALILFGCASKPPSALEQRLFTIVTNGPVLEVRTNVIPVTIIRTNEVQITITNITGVTEVHTNYVTVPVVTYQTNLAVVTNQPATYVYTPGPGAAQIAGTARDTVGTFNPLAGGVVGAGLTALFTVWGWLRSNKRNVTTVATLAQDIEVIRKFLVSLPNGQTYDAALVQFMQQHQAEAGVLQQVVGVLDSYVNAGNAQVAAQGVINTIDALRGLQTPQAPGKV